jgi:hypothetical protein
MESLDDTNKSSVRRSAWLLEEEGSAVLDPCLCTQTATVKLQMLQDLPSLISKLVSSDFCLLHTLLPTKKKLLLQSNNDVSLLPPPALQVLHDNPSYNFSAPFLYRHFTDKSEAKQP